MRRVLLAMGSIVAVAGCDTVTAPNEIVTGLIYTLEPSGVPGEPLGVKLEWLAVGATDIEIYNVYGRLEGSNTFDLRGSTTSLSFHDAGLPDIEYRVTWVNVEGEESPPSETVFIDERLALETPTNLVSTSLDGAIFLAWDDNAFETAPVNAFKQYRVYSTPYDLDVGECLDDWDPEGTTIAPEFIVSALTNGFPMCFWVSSESVEGFESNLSNIVADTPRPDARNVLMVPLQDDVTQAGFRFFDDLDADGFVDDNELGLITRSDLTTIDFRISRDAGGVVFIEPVRTGTGVALYSVQPIDDLVDIDVAPAAGFDVTPISAEPGFGYVFEMDGGDGFARFGALRMTHVGTDFVIFDWSYQTDPGNPELSIAGGRAVSDGELVVTGRR